MFNGLLTSIISAPNHSMCVVKESKMYDLAYFNPNKTGMFECNFFWGVNFDHHPPPTRPCFSYFKENADACCYGFYVYCGCFYFYIKLETLKNAQALGKVENLL